MKTNDLLDPIKAMEVLHGKKVVIIDNSGVDASKIIKVGKAHRDILISLPDIEDQPLDVRKYISDDSSNIKYLSKCCNIDALTLSEINETIEALKRVKNEVMNKVVKDKGRWDELRKKDVKYYIDRDNCQNEEELELCEVAERLKKQFPEHKTRIEEGGIIEEETDEQRLQRLRFLIGDRQIYWRKQDIPAGKEFDIFREYLCLHSRLQKRKQRARKKVQENVEILNNRQTDVVFPQQVTTSSGCILELIASNPITPNSIFDLNRITSNTNTSTHTEQPSQVIHSSSGFIMEVIPSYNTEPNASRLADKLISNEYGSYIPEDVEASSDPLKILNWYDYYFGNTFITELNIEKQMTWQDWDRIRNIYKVLASIPSARDEELKSRRETYLTYAILDKFKVLGCKLPVINDYVP